MNQARAERRGRKVAEVVIKLFEFQGDAIRTGWHRHPAVGAAALAGVLTPWMGFAVTFAIVETALGGVIWAGLVLTPSWYFSQPVDTAQQQPQQRQQRQPQQQPQQPPQQQQQPPQQGQEGQQQKEQETESDGPQYVKEPPEIDFSDVAGNQDLIDELRDKVIDPIRNPERYEEYGLGVETGFLLYGPPGTGKTYTTKALAGELGLNWMPVKGSDLNSTIVGGGTENIAEMFDEARENQPVLLFLDEIDQLVPERGGHNQHEDTTKQVNTMLEEVSDIHDSDDEIVVIGATNRQDRIDDAMLRSGRLTTQIEVPYPDEEARVMILDQHLDAPRRNINFHEVAPASEGLSAADMEAVSDEAARLAMERNEGVDTDDVLTAIEKVS